MIKINTIQHYLSMSGIRITVSDVSSAAAKVQELHHLPALTAVIMGKILAGTSVLATDFKNHEGISILWQTNSILGSIHTDAYEGYFIRGYVDTADDNLPVTSHNEKLLISDKAQLTVTR
ncbi:Hsp33 family molecular chaperone HslO, partial [Dialister invisus]|uniref:Hsp33 family molecular chaperone HslO n=1 Tax=Dialister invisus TaxID=218538 RepID=UPI00307CBFEE